MILETILDAITQAYNEFFMLLNDLIKSPKYANIKDSLQVVFSNIVEQKDAVFRAISETKLGDIFSVNNLIRNLYVTIKGWNGMIADAFKKIAPKKIETRYLTPGGDQVKKFISVTLLPVSSKSGNDKFITVLLKEFKSESPRTTSSDTQGTHKSSSEDDHTTKPSSPRNTYDEISPLPKSPGDFYDFSFPKGQHIRTMSSASDDEFITDYTEAPTSTTITELVVPSSPLKVSPHSVPVEGLSKYSASQPKKHSLLNIGDAIMHAVRRVRAPQVQIPTAIYNESMHLFLDASQKQTNIIVCEDEPSTIIAYTLCSAKYPELVGIDNMKDEDLESIIKSKDKFHYKYSKKLKNHLLISFRIPR